MSNDVIKVLDYGEVELIDYMGSDSRIAQAARVSTQKHTQKIDVEKDRTLIRYLMRNKHTSPFEHVEFEFRIKLPIFIARQWIRHRTANVNEISGRYSILPTEFYKPDIERIKGKGKMNKQGSEGELDERLKDDWLWKLSEEYVSDTQLYNMANSFNISNELARISLPLSTYTEWYWKIDLHNLFHFLELRLHPHAQWEIQEYAKVLYEIIKPIVPLACEAFEEYRLNARTFSKTEMDALKKLLELPHADWTKIITNELEQKDFKEKLGFL